MAITSAALARIRVLALVVQLLAPTTTGVPMRHLVIATVIRFASEPVSGTSLVREPAPLASASRATVSVAPAFLAAVGTR